MYDKFRLILRIETTVVKVSFFKHYREVEHQDGTRTRAWAERKKSIYSLAPLRELLLAANRRYLEFISTIEDDKALRSGAHLHGSGQDRACRGVLASLRTSRLEKNNSFATALGCPTQSISRLTAPREVAATAGFIINSIGLCCRVPRRQSRGNSI